VGETVFDVPASVITVEGYQWCRTAHSTSRGSVLLQPQWPNPKGRGNFWSFLLHWKYIVWAIFLYEFRYEGSISLKFTSLP